MFPNLLKTYTAYDYEFYVQWSVHRIICVNNYPTRCNKCTFYLYLQTALHISGVISTHHHEVISLYLQNLTLLGPLMLPVVNVTGSSNGLNNVRYCRCSDMSS